MSRKRTERDVLIPDEMETLANDFKVILHRSVEENLNQMLTPEESKKEKTLNAWVDLMQASTPKDISEWSNKDFVHWFIQQLNKKHQVSYIVEYSRDCSSVKKIREQLMSVGMGDPQIIQDFMIWTINNYQRLKDINDRFDLPVLDKFLNEYLQSKEETDNERSLGFDIIETMDSMRKNNKNAMIDLLARFGVPLTIEYYVRQGHTTLEVVDAVKTRLEYLARSNTITLRSVFQNSLDLSPYPSWFHVNDWRALYNNIIVQNDISKLNWWKNEDFTGNYAREYDSFKEK